MIVQSDDTHLDWAHQVDAVVVTGFTAVYSDAGHPNIIALAKVRTPMRSAFFRAYSVENDLLMSASSG